MEITLKEKEAAVVFAEDGKLHSFLPQTDDDSEVSDGMMMCVMAMLLFTDDNADLLHQLCQRVDAAIEKKQQQQES